MPTTLRHREKQKDRQLKQCTPYKDETRLSRDALLRESERVFVLGQIDSSFVKVGTFFP